MTQLIRYDAARRAVAAAKNVDEVKDILSQAEAMRAYARMAKDGEMLADAAEIRKRAERQLDRLVKAQAETVGLAPPGRPPKNGVSKTPITEKPPTLAEAGIDKNLAKRAREAGRDTDEEFEERVRIVRQAAVEGVRKADRAIDGERRRAAARAPYQAAAGEGCTVADLRALAKRGQRFGVIYADPPWSFEVYSGKGKARSADRHYDTMSLADIKRLPVAKLAAEDCALFLWGVWPELPGALDVIAAWGFAYKTAGFVWVKQNRGGSGLFTGMGYWTRANSEPCLLATRGSPLRLAQDVHQIIHAPVAKHSEKPAEARRRITRLLPGPYLELFGRRPAPGWTVWGNEIEPGAMAAAAE